MREKLRLRLPSWATPGPKVFVVATAVAFGGAYLAAGLKPWGIYVAAGLMLAWVCIALFSAYRPAVRDGNAGDARVNEPRWVLALRFIIWCVSFGLYLYAMLLDHQGKPAHQFVRYSLVATAVLWVGNLLLWLPANSARVRAAKLKSR